MVHAFFAFARELSRGSRRYITLGAQPMRMKFPLAMTCSCPTNLQREFRIAKGFMVLGVDGFLFNVDMAAA
jgi:hypothetical protein